MPVHLYNLPMLINLMQIQCIVYTECFMMKKKKKRQVQRYHKGIITKGLYVHLNNHGREGGRVKEI